MSKSTYRFYRLDGVGHLQGAEWFASESDEIAVELIRVRHPEARIEIWQRERLVAKISPARLRA